MVPGTPTLTIIWRRPWCSTETVPSAFPGAATGRYGSGPWNNQTNYYLAQAWVFNWDGTFPGAATGRYGSGPCNTHTNYFLVQSLVLNRDCTVPSAFPGAAATGWYGSGPWNTHTNYYLAQALVLNRDGTVPVPFQEQQQRNGTARVPGTSKLTFYLAQALVLNRDGTQCLSGSSDGTVRLWSLGQQRCIATFHPHSEGVWALQPNETFTQVGVSFFVWRVSFL